MYDRQRTRALHTAGKAWRQIRESVLVRDLYRCRACKAFGDEVDHRDGDSHNNALDNLQTLCRSCHSRKTAREMAGGSIP